MRVAVQGRLLSWMAGLFDYQLLRIVTAAHGLIAQNGQSRLLAFQAFSPDIIALTQ